MYRKDSFSSSRKKVGVSSQPNRHRVRTLPWKVVCWSLCSIVVLSTLIFVGKNVYAFVYKEYHSKDLPSMSIFSDYDWQHFMKIYDVTPDSNGTEPDEIACISEYSFKPEPGHTYEVQINYCEATDPQDNIVYDRAEDVRIQVYLPHKFTDVTWARKLGDYYVVYDFISVDIATNDGCSGLVSDWVEFRSSEDLAFAYVDGNATCYSQDYPDGYVIDGKGLFAPGGALVDSDICNEGECAWMVKFRFEVSKTN